MWIFCNSVK